MATPGSRVGGRSSDDKSVKPDLLDFLFTLALTIGLAPEILMRPGLASRDFVVALPSGEALFDLGTFIVGILTLLFSWYGFNASVSSRPVLYGSVAGLFRFSLDAILVVLYGFLLIQYQNFELVLLTITLIYVLYTAWDALKLFEYHKDPRLTRYSWRTDNRAGKCTQQVCEYIVQHTEKWYALLLAELIEALSGVYAILYLVISAVYFLVFSGFTGSAVDWLILAVLLVTTISYRVQKLGYKIRPPQDNIRESL